MKVDTYYRATEMNLTGYSHMMYKVDYDPGTNNVKKTESPFSVPVIYVYGWHGNELQHRSHNPNLMGDDEVSGVNGATDDVVATTYYDGSCYFQKASVTDANGRTTTFGVGMKSDPNPGNRGSILWVQDAGYNDPNSSSYQKQFTYTYLPTGQKESETNLNADLTKYSYGGQTDGTNALGVPVGNLTQVVQDAIPAVSQPGRSTYSQRTTKMSYDEAGPVLSSTDPMNLTSTFTYNVLGQPMTAQFPHKVDGSGVETTPAESIAYDYSEANSNSRLHSVTQTLALQRLAFLVACLSF